MREHLPTSWIIGIWKIPTLVAEPERKDDDEDAEVLEDASRLLAKARTAIRKV
jgi:hypothetical protein